MKFKIMFSELSGTYGIIVLAVPGLDSTGRFLQFLLEGFNLAIDYQNVYSEMNKKSSACQHH